jgi:glycine dehydrogenase subunit 1
MTLHGGTGLSALARINHARARTTMAAVEAIEGVEVLTPRMFNEFAVRVPGSAAELVEALATRGVLAGVPFSRLDPAAKLDDVLLLCATEMTTAEDIEVLVQALKAELGS